MDVRVEQLRFERSGRLVLSIDELDFPAGQTTAVLGPNGAGKTTLLRLVSGLEKKPTSGRVLVGKAEVSGVSGSVDILFQSPVFLRGSVRENIDLALELRGLSRRERSRLLEEIAKRLDITALLDRPAQSLSRGEAQLVSLARCLAHPKPVVLL